MSSLLRISHHVSKLKDVYLPIFERKRPRVIWSPSRSEYSTKTEKKMTVLIFTWLSAQSLINIMIHCAGIKLLLHLYRENDKVQTLLLIHLSATEIFGSTCWLIIDALQVVQLSYPSTPSKIIEVIQICICTITSTTFRFVYYLVMIYIVLEKFLDIKLDLKYHLYCDARRVNNLMSGTWLFGWMSSISLILVTQVGGVSYHLSFLKFVYPTFDISLL